MQSLCIHGEHISLFSPSPETLSSPTLRGVGASAPRHFAGTTACSVCNCTILGHNPGWVLLGTSWRKEASPLVFKAGMAWLPWYYLHPWPLENHPRAQGPLPSWAFFQSSFSFDWNIWFMLFCNFLHLVNPGICSWKSQALESICGTEKGCSQ